MLFHQIVLTQGRMYPPARTYLLRRIAEGKTKREARRALKRLIVRRVKPTPGSQLALFALYDFHAFITDRDGETLVLEPTIAATPRSRTRSATSSRGSG